MTSNNWKENEQIKALCDSGNLPGVGEAFEILVGRLPPPLNIDKTSYLSLCQAVLDDAIDQVEIRRTGKPVFWPTPRLGNTNIVHHDAVNNRIPCSGERHETNMLQSEVSDDMT